jgi:hypothetical protein
LLTNALWEELELSSIESCDSVRGPIPGNSVRGGDLLDEETRGFLNCCLSRAAESIRSGASDAVRNAQVEREVAQIRVNASAALERLEVGQVTAALTFKGARYMG